MTIQELIPANINEIFHLLSQIHTSVADDLKQALGMEGFRKAWLFQNQQSKGVLVIYRIKNKITAAISFTSDDYLDEPTLIELKNLFFDSLNHIELATVDLVINNYNTRISSYFKQYGFITDDCGFQLKYDLHENINFIERKHLSILGFSDDQALTYMTVIDDAFNPLRQRLGLPPNARRSQYDKSLHKLVAANARGDFMALWNDSLDSLLGVAILEQNIIETLSVNPLYQRHGYGQYLLKYCLKTLVEREYDEAYLCVVSINTEAIKLYQRIGFTIIGAYEGLKYHKFYC